MSLTVHFYLDFSTITNSVSSDLKANVYPRRRQGTRVVLIIRARQILLAWHEFVSICKRQSKLAT